MSFDDFLDRLWGYDFEVTAYDWLLVLKDYRNRKRIVFHNSSPNDIQNFIDVYNPIMLGYNNNGYDKFILKGILNGCTVEEIKDINDYIIVDGGNGWELDLGYTQVPTQVDLINCIVPRKSLKELEGNLRMNITESTVDFDIDHKWNDQEFEEMLYYCDHDVDALFPIFDILMNRFKSKFIVAKICNIDVEKAMSLTDANLTALSLGAEKQEHDDQFLYEFPDVIDKNKIPKEFLDYIQMCREHNNDYDYIKEHPMKPIHIDGLEIQVQLGGIHGFPAGRTIRYGENEVFTCE